MATLSVAFEEHENSPIESGNFAGEFNFKRIFLVAWADRYTFLEELYTGNTGGGPMPYSSAIPFLFPDEFSIKRLVNKPVQDAPFTDPAAEIINHDTEAMITVNYRPFSLDGISEDLQAGSYANYQQTQKVEYATIPGISLQWESRADVLPADVSMAIINPTTAHIVEWNQVQTPPWALISSMKGKINSADFTIPGSLQVAEPGTLLFAGSEASRSFDFQQNETWKFRMTFLEKSQHALVGTSQAANRRHWDGLRMELPI